MRYLYYLVVLHFDGLQAIGKRNFTLVGSAEKCRCESL